MIVPYTSHTRVVTLLAAALAASLALALSACQQDSVAPAKPDRDEAWIKLHNETGVTLTEFNVVPAPEGGAGWGENQFGEETLDHGKTFTLKGVPCPDEFDLRVIGADGGEARREGASLECGKTFDWGVNGLSS